MSNSSIEAGEAEKQPEPTSQAITTAEREEVEKQVDSPDVHVSYLTLYRYATPLDVVGLVVGLLFSAASGAILPFLTLLFGNLTASFQSFSTGSTDASFARSEINSYSLDLFYLALGEFASLFVATALFSTIGEHITLRTRQHYLRAILRQNVAYFDRVGAGDVATRLSSHMNLMQDGISEKVTFVVSGLAAFVAALAISLYKSWKLSLIVLSTVVAMVLAIGVGGKLSMRYKAGALQAQAAASNAAEEAVAAIRTTTAFGAQRAMLRRYEGHLDGSERWGFRARAAGGTMLGVVTAIIYMEHALSFWQGSRFLVAGEISLAAVVTIQIAIMMAGAYLAMMLPHFAAIPSAVAVGKKVFGTIDRVSLVDPFDEKGRRLDQVKGTLAFHDIRFAYPSRDEAVFQSLSFSIPEGKVTAIVGPSGCGKSTIVSLIQRFYLPLSGSITLDGVDTAELNVRWLRQQMSVVSQEPVLFSGTIFENIEAGLVGNAHKEKSQAEKMTLVTLAAQTANAHGFIESMPRGYETQVGERGFLLSGGQKQRIAIARAIVSNPKILLLDEATSALDSKSEGIVQQAIDNASQGRTTLVIAHRLSTIKKADNIIVLAKGVIKEHGTHGQLVQERGIYSRLVEAQALIREGTSQKTLDGPAVDDTQMQEKASAEADEGPPLLTESSTLEKVSRTLSTLPKAKKSSRKLVNFMLALSKEDKWTLLAGLCFSILSGANQPVRGILFGNAIMAISLPPSQTEKIRSDSDFWSGMFLMLGLVQLFALTGQGVSFALASERLVRRAQTLALQNILRQDISFFDKKENSAGSLTAMLSKEATMLAGVSGATLGAIIVFFTTVLGSIGISLGYGWKLSLVCISVMPVLIFCGFLRIRVLAAYDKRVGRTTDAAAFACEATAAIRTVASLTLEERMLEKYHELLVAEAVHSVRFFMRSSAAVAVSQSIMFAASALGFWYGGNLLVSGEYTTLTFFICFTETLFGAQAAGNIVSFAPEFGSGKDAAERFKDIIETRPQIDSASTVGRAVSQVQGRVEFRDVHFRYPERLDHPVLNGLSFTAEPGQFIALVGPSGCGKSTVLALLERFYDPKTGLICLDGQGTSSLNIPEYRRQFALVSQDTALYSTTVRENLCLDLEDVDDTRIDSACRAANIHDLVSTLPDGLDTFVGPKGSSLSGGQRQRLAIARALLHNPRILLLDEATSALDTASEKVVEEALREASRGRTTIAIAHRLSSIYHADAIYVMDAGRVVESGTHDQLMARRETYWEMVTLQSLSLED